MLQESKRKKEGTAAQKRAHSNVSGIEGLEGMVYEMENMLRLVW